MCTYADIYFLALFTQRAWKPQLPRSKEFPKCLDFGFQIPPCNERNQGSQGRQSTRRDWNFLRRKLRKSSRNNEDILKGHSTRFEGGSHRPKWNNLSIKMISVNTTYGSKGINKPMLIYMNEWMRRGALLYGRMSTKKYRRKDRNRKSFYPYF